MVINHIKWLAIAAYGQIKTRPLELFSTTSLQLVTLEQDNSLN